MRIVAIQARNISGRTGTSVDSVNGIFMLNPSIAYQNTLNKVKNTSTLSSFKIVFLHRKEGHP
jgi:hypothetical protein